jgi:uncharacterized protein (DUF1800 family)
MNPGAKTFLGHTIPEGFAGSEAALELIAEHPATHRHLATKLVRHYVADVPPPQCVDRIATVLQQTGGDLKQAMLAIFDLSEARRAPPWSAPLHLWGIQFWIKRLSADRMPIRARRRHPNGR